MTFRVYSCDFEIIHKDGFRMLKKWEKVWNLWKQWQSFYCVTSNSFSSFLNHLSFSISSSPSLFFDLSCHVIFLLQWLPWYPSSYKEVIDISFTTNSPLVLPTPVTITSSTTSGIPLYVFFTWKIHSPLNNYDIFIATVELHSWDVKACLLFLSSVPLALFSLFLIDNLKCK